MQVNGLQIEDIDFLLRAFSYSAEPEFLHMLKDSKAYFQQVEEFLPRLVDQVETELLRCNLTDIVTLMDSFFKLWNKNAFTKSHLPLKAVYVNADVYLGEFLGQSKKDITGS